MKYSKDFKQEVVKLVVEDGKPVSVVANAYNIDKCMLHKWVGYYKEYGKNAFVGSGFIREENAELRKLKKENELLKLENLLLKKMAKYDALKKK